MPTVTLKFNSASSEGVNFSYSTSGWTSLPSDESVSSIHWGSWSGGTTRQTRTGYTTQVKYSLGTTKWSWTFTRGSGSSGGTSSSKDGSATINGYIAGSKQSVTAKISATRTSKIERVNYRQTRTRSPIKDDKGNITGYTPWDVGSATRTGKSTSSSSATKSLGSAHNTLYFYTRPLQFAWTNIPARDKLISVCLTASKWNELMDKAAQKYNWKHCQQGQGGTPRSTGQYHVTTGTLITHTIYNNGSNWCGASKTVKQGDTITYDLFTALSNAVNAG